MNRKMRAKLANKTARAKKERRPCPMRDSVVFANSNDIPLCDSCGSELVPVALVAVPFEAPDKRHLH